MKLAIIGYGKMGRAIEEVVNEQFPDVEIVLKIDASNLDSFTKENLQKTDVAIEFTNPESAFLNIKSCIEWGIPVVSGSTGWLDKIEVIKELTKTHNCGFFYAPNFSLGVNIYFEANRKLAELMNQHQNYSVSIEEIHHTEKKDAPSGTAIRTAEIIIDALDSKHSWSSETSHSSDELPVSSKRIPNVPGTHIVSYKSSVDSIELSHTAFSRRGFAEGAVIAARWIKGKSGYFEMKDLLNF